jgi:hypothetical protein
LVEFYNQGRDAGLQWANESAECEQLDRLTALRDDHPHDWDSLFHEDDNAAWSCCEWLFFQIEPGCDGCRQEAIHFWEMVLYDDDKQLAWEPEFVRGFVEAAIERWEELKPEL